MFDSLSLTCKSEKVNFLVPHCDFLNSHDFSLVVKNQTYMLDLLKGNL